MARILMLAPNRGPPFDEAWTNRVRDLSAILKADVFATGRCRSLIKEKKGRYTVFRQGILGTVMLLLYTIFRQRGYDLVMIEEKADTKSGIAILLLMLSGIISPAKCICQFGKEWEGDFRRSGKVMSLYVSRILPRCRLVNVMNLESARYLEKRIGKERIIFLNGVDCGKFGHVPAKGGPFRILFASAPIGNDSSSFMYKGINLLMKAAARVKEERDNIRLVLVWRGHMADEIRDLIRESGMENHAEVVDGAVDMRRYFNECHVTLLTPERIKSSRPYPTSLMESLASGKPVIVSELLEISKIIRREGCGKVCRPDAQDLAKKIKEAMDEYAKLQRNCRKTALRYFDIRKSAARLERMI
jgi:glycosyltransferase involved in cell wall biosynthesis